MRQAERILVICGFSVAALAATAAPCMAQQEPWLDPLASEPVGWYTVGPDHEVLVTWAPEGEDLRLLDFDSARFSKLKRSGDSAFTWQPDGDAPERLVTFVRDERGEVSELRWRTADGEAGFLPRSLEFPFDHELVSFRNDTVELTGLLMVPRVRKFVGDSREGLEEVPVVLPGAVVIHGSGSNDRDNVWAFHIAQHLARNGVAVLLPDKRGSGGSGGDWRVADFSELAEDALAAAEVLGEHPSVDADRVGFVGLSQGGWIAPLAATRRAGSAFVVNISGAAVTPGEQVRHEIEQDLRGAGVPGDAIPTVLELLEQADQYARTLSDSDWNAYVQLRQELLSTPLAEAVQPFPDTREHWQWQWWHRVIDFDPLPYLSEFGAPVLVVYGAEDEHDNVPVEASVARLRPILMPERLPENEIRVFPGIGHALGDPESGWISGDFLELLSEWMKQNIGEERDHQRIR